MTILLTRERPCVALPLDNEAPVRRLEFRSGGRVIGWLDCALRPERPVYWMYPDFTAFLGEAETLELTVEPEIALASAPLPQPAWQLPCRPLTRYSPPFGWNNDPNGLCRFGGLWHLFYQHNPAGTTWGNMHWGHAVSEDLLRWRELPEALYPDKMGPMFSGSAVADPDNVSGLGTAEQPALLLFYTAAGDPATQCVAYSRDGVRFRKLPENPVVPQRVPGNRDPKVVYCRELGRYVMAIYLEGDRYGLLTSDNLLRWEFLQELPLPGDWECPDLYPLRGDDGARKWVFSGASDSYLVGDFREGRFVPTQAQRRLCDPALLGVKTLAYAAQTFWEGDALQDTRVRLSWLRRGTPVGAPFSQCMSFPQSLRLCREGDGYRLVCLPHESVRQLFAPTGEAALAEATVQCQAGAWLCLWGARIPLPPLPEPTEVTVLLDRGVCELYIPGAGIYFAGETPWEVRPEEGLRCGDGVILRQSVQPLRAARA